MVWVTFTILEAGLIFGVIGITFLASRLADRVFVRRRVKHLDQEYEKLTGSRRNV